MIGLPAGTRIWIAAGVTDLRRGFTGLSGMVQTTLQENPFLCGGLQSVAPAARAHEFSLPSDSRPTHILRRSFSSTTRRSARSFRREGHVEPLFQVSRRASAYAAWAARSRDRQGRRRSRASRLRILIGKALSEFDCKLQPLRAAVRLRSGTDD